MLLDLPTGSECFVDTNILYSHLVPVPEISEARSDFVTRIFRGDVVATVSFGVLADLMHKLMVLEAASRLNIDRAGAVSRLRREPDVLRQLTPTLC